MAPEQLVSLDAGLYFVATPIGSARDITLRALDVLASADVLSAEDTRSLRKLLSIHQIPLNGRKIISYNDHNGGIKRSILLKAMEEGKSVSYSSEAGTPLVADPGYQLGRAVIEAGHKLTIVPGACAVIAALTVSGLPTDQFFFGGFLPTTRSQRQRILIDLKNYSATLVFYESPKRIHKTLDDMMLVFGANRPIVLARELTKKFEEVLRTTVGGLKEVLEGKLLKGEAVLLIGRGEEHQVSLEALDLLLLKNLEKLSVKDAVLKVSLETGMARSKVYQAALELKNSQ